MCTKGHQGTEGPVGLNIKNEPMLKFFQYLHLPANLQKISKRFAEMAAFIEMIIARSPERTVALRKLLESKDAAVRSAIETQERKPE